MYPAFTRGSDNLASLDSEVRRAALFNLIPSATTLPHLLRRTLDIDTTNRRLAFSHVLVEIPPRSLTKTQRREIMGRGLRDREEAVRKAAKKLVAKWLEQVDKDEGCEATIEAFVGFFDLFDEEGQKVAEKALEALFEVRPDLIQDVEFSGAFRSSPSFTLNRPLGRPADDFYQTLTPSTAFLVRVYLNYLRAVDSPLLADLEPVVTALAFHLQAAWTQLVVALEADERDEQKEAREEFIVGELVGIAVNLDYGDEIGRRKMFELMRTPSVSLFAPHGR